MKSTTPKQLRYYVAPTQKIPFLEWLNHLKDPQIRARIRTRLDRLEQGNYGDYKSVGDGVFELRLDFGSGYRIYYAEAGDCLVILLCGGDKRTQTADIQTAKRYWQALQESSL